MKSEHPESDSELHRREPMRIAFALIALLLGIAASIGAPEAGTAARDAAAATAAR